MPYHTHTFLFHISPHYFPGHTVKQPFFAQVEYSYQKQHFHEVLNVTISISAIGKLAHGDNLAQEMTEAARQHHEKNYSNPDDLKDIPVFKQSKTGREIDGEINNELKRSNIH